MEKDGYLKIKNIDYNSTLPSYELIKKENKQIYDLLMISAYDESSINNPKLLKVAKDLARWILQNDKLVLPYEIKILNYLQIIRRERELNIGFIKNQGE